MTDSVANLEGVSSMVTLHFFLCLKMVTPDITFCKFARLDLSPAYFIYILSHTLFLKGSLLTVKTKNLLDCNYKTIISAN